MSWFLCGEGIYLHDVATRDLGIKGLEDSESPARRPFRNVRLFRMYY